MILREIDVRYFSLWSTCYFLDEKPSNKNSLHNNNNKTWIFGDTFRYFAIILTPIHQIFKLRGNNFRAVLMKHM